MAKKSYNDIISTPERQNIEKIPFWRLKVTDSEFEELRNYLVEEYRKYRSFNTCPREAALYMAEWWKRDPGTETNEGRIMDRIFSSLNLGQSQDGANSLSENAYKVMDSRSYHYLGFKPLVTKGTQRMRTNYLYSILYQGGFPFGKACDGNENNKWKLLIPQFTRKNLNLEDVPGSLIASKLLEEYKDVLVDAARNHCPADMPFYCDGPDHRWYRLAVEGVKKGDESIAARPFSFRWIIRKSGTEATLFYEVHGPRVLSKTFTDAHRNAASSDTITIQLYQEDRCIASLAEYKRRDGESEYVSYHELRSQRIPYDGTSKLTVRIAETMESVAQSDFDIQYPHTFFLNNNSEYEAGSRFRNRRSVILFKKDGWALEKSEGEHILQQVRFFNEPYCFLICDPPRDGDSYFELRSTTDRGQLFRAGASAPDPEWFDVAITGKLSSLFEESGVGDFTSEDYVEVRHFLSDDDYRLIRFTDRLYRPAGSDGWSKNAPIGRIECSADKKGSEFITPARGLVNVGSGLKVKASRFNRREQTTFYILDWDQGEITVTDARATRNGSEWVFRRSDFPNTVPCHFIPDEGEPFDLNLKVIYKDSAVFAPNGERISYGEVIPESRLSEYRYMVHGEEETGLKRGASLRTLVPIDEENWRGVRPEGPLRLLLEKVNETLDGYNSPPIDRMPGIESGIDYDGLGGYFTVVKYPILLDYDKAGKTFSASLTLNSDGLPQYYLDNRQAFVDQFSGHLIMIPLSGSDVVTVERSADGLYRLPDISGEFLVTSDMNGHIRPFILDTEDGLMTTDSEKEKEILLSTPLGTGAWNEVDRFLAASGEYSIEPSLLPWLGTVLSDWTLFNLYVILGVATRYGNAAELETYRATMNIAFMNLSREFAKTVNCDMLKAKKADLITAEQFASQIDIWSRTDGNGETSVKGFVDAVVTKLNQIF